MVYYYLFIILFSEYMQKTISYKLGKIYRISWNLTSFVGDVKRY